ncbi:hypothetical protein [Streptomyces chartreusis]|uniref:hypothetical protein n=1 Tax=Streptomyces chartreusis TaxID=1969 RepID=UPI003411C5AD
MATDLMMIVLGAPLAWNATAPRIRNPRDEPAERRLAAHRHSVVIAVTALTAALTTHA